MPSQPYPVFESEGYLYDPLLTPEVFCSVWERNIEGFHPAGKRRDRKRGPGGEAVLSSWDLVLESVHIFIALLSKHHVLCAQALGSGWPGCGAVDR